MGASAGLIDSRVANASATANPGPYDPLRQMVPLRKQADVPDTFDSERVMRFLTEFQSQTNNLLVSDRQIEMNVRMICGQQHSVWHPQYGKFIDTMDWLGDNEKSWRQMPVINKLLRWFVMTHTRLTENPPILTVLPGPDRIDAEMAEVVDTLLKKDWRDAGMDSVHDRLMKWVVIAGEGYLMTRLDRTKGDWYPWVANEPLPLVGYDGAPIFDKITGKIAFSPEAIPNVPIGPDGTPNVAMRVDGQVIPLGDGRPHFERSGGITVDVYSPLQVRGQWGLDIPWEKKQWHCVQRFLTPDEVFETWGVEVAPDLSAQAASNIATIERLLYGTGFFGTSTARWGNGWSDNASKGPLCTIYERWQAPIPYNEKLVGTWAEPMMESPENPGGRHTVWSPNKLIRDGARTVAWPNVSPLRCFRFIDVPGRPRGMSILETLLGPQRSLNKSYGQLLEHAALLGSPQMVVDEDAGIQPNQITNEPNKIYTAKKRPGVAAVEYVDAPAISTDVLEAIRFMGNEVDSLGGLQGTEGQTPTDNASGELVKELRFNSDRLLGSTARRNVMEYARIADDWMKLYPIIYTQQQVITINGIDQMATTVTVYPELFKNGHANISPDVESMLPEGRGERQQRAFSLYMNGVFGPPGTPQAIEVFLELFRFPNYARMARPGGVDRVTAEQENGKLLTGQLDQPVLQWYDHQVHLTVHEKYMKSPEYLKQPPEIQMAFEVHRQMHIIELQKIIAFQAQATKSQIENEAPAREQGAPGGQKQIGAGGKAPTESMTADIPGEGEPPKSVAAQGGPMPLAPSSGPQE